MKADKQDSVFGVVTDSSGNIVGEQRYYPFGETRLSAGTLYTDKLYTRWIEPVEIGQRNITGLGIYHIQSTNLEGLMIYSKGKLVKEAGVETYYFLVSSKKAT